MELGNLLDWVGDKSRAFIWAVLDKTDLGRWIRFSGLDLMVEIDLCTLSLGGFNETKVRSFISSGEIARPYPIKRDRVKRNYTVT